MFLKTVLALLFIISHSLAEAIIRPQPHATQTTAAHPSTLSLLGSSFKTCLPPATAHTGRNIPSLQFLRPSRGCSTTGRNIQSYLRATKCTRGFSSQLPVATATAAPTRGRVSYFLFSRPGDGSADPETSALTSRVTPHLPPYLPPRTCWPSAR